MASSGTMHSIVAGLDASRRRIEESLSSGRAQAAIKYVKALVRQSKKDRGVLMEDDAGRLYLRELETYLNEMGPRMEKAILHGEAVAYVSTGNTLLKRLAGAEKTQQREAAGRYRAQVQKLILSLDGRFDGNEAVETFLARCRDVQPPLKIPEVAVRSPSADRRSEGTGSRPASAASGLSRSRGSKTDLHVDVGGDADEGAQSPTAAARRRSSGALSAALSADGHELSASEKEELLTRYIADESERELEELMADLEKWKKQREQLEKLHNASMTSLREADAPASPFSSKQRTILEKLTNVLNETSLGSPIGSARRPKSSQLSFDAAADDVSVLNGPTTPIHTPGSALSSDSGLASGFGLSSSSSPVD